MKQFVFSLIALLTFVNVAWAQDDDVYFVPTKKALKNEQRQYMNKTYSGSDDVFEYDHWSNERSEGTRSVDEYNRRYKKGKVARQHDSVSCCQNDVEEQNMTGRIVRFRSPRAAIVASPYYYDYYYDLAYYDPWFYDWGRIGWYGWMDPFYFGIGWNIRFSPWNPFWPYGRYYSWYGGWGWNPWFPHYGWNDPFFWWNNSYTFAPRNAVYYGGTRGSNVSYGTRGGSFASRENGGRSRGGSFVERGGSYRSSRSGGEFSRSRESGYGRSMEHRGRNIDANVGTSRRGNIIGHSRSDQSSNSYGTQDNRHTRSYESSNGTYSSGGSRGGNFSSGRSGGSFSTGGGFSTGRSGGFSSGGSSRGGGSIVGGRR